MCALTIKLTGPGKGLDKAGLFLFQVAAGRGHLEMKGKRHYLERGQDCWMVDLRHPRSYLPADGKVLRTDGLRFSGPGVEAWLELLGPVPVFTLLRGALRLRLGRLRRLVQQRPPQFEWQVHSELTALWGELLAARRVFTMPKTADPPSVARVLDAVSRAVSCVTRVGSFGMGFGSIAMVE